MPTPAITFVFMINCFIVIERLRLLLYRYSPENSRDIGSIPKLFKGFICRGLPDTQTIEPNLRGSFIRKDIPDEKIITT